MNPKARFFATVYFGVECGLNGTDVEFESDGGDTWARLSMNLNSRGQQNPSSPYDFAVNYNAGKDGTHRAFKKINLGSKGGASNLYTAMEHSMASLTGPHTDPLAEIEVLDLDDSN